MIWQAKPAVFSSRVETTVPPDVKITTPVVWCLAAVLFVAIWPARSRAASPWPQQAITAARDLQIASRFAPIFYQALGDNPRSDYLTNFNFDGDWLGNNNWENAGDKKFSLRGYVYYSVVETQSHWFIHYAVFHPRDYKGGERKGRILSELIREGIKRGGEYDPTGLADEAGVAHENDFEGALVVVSKQGDDLDQARVVYVETMHHSSFSRYVPGEVATKGYGLFRAEGQHVLLYIEPKGHGIESYDGSEKQTSKKEFVIYRVAEKAEDPEQTKAPFTGYELIPISTTLWTHAKLKARDNKTYGGFQDYGEIAISVAQAKGRAVNRKFKVGLLGSAFVGDTGGVNMARPPWAWFDKSRRNDKIGLWFFDPATIIKRDFGLDNSFSTAYSRVPFWAE